MEAPRSKDRVTLELEVSPELHELLSGGWGGARDPGAWGPGLRAQPHPPLRKGAVSFGTAQITNDRESWGSRVDGMLDGRGPRTDTWPSGGPSRERDGGRSASRLSLCSNPPNFPRPFSEWASAHLSFRPSVGDAHP